MKIILSENVYKKLIAEEKTYFIGSGRKHGFYTLRIFDSETDTSYYITTLAVDKQKAIEKARAITGMDLQIDFDLSEWGTNYEPDVDCNIMPIGREHKYKPLSEVPEGYLYWFYFNVNDKKYDCVKRSIETLIPEKIATETQRRYNVHLDLQKQAEEKIALQSKYKPLEVGKKYQMEMFFEGASFYDDMLIFSNRNDVAVVIDARIKDVGYGLTYEWEGSGGFRKLKKHEQYSIEFEVKQVEEKKFQADSKLSNIPVNVLKSLNLLSTVKGIAKTGGLTITDVRSFKYGRMYFLSDGQNNFFTKLNDVKTNLLVDLSKSDSEVNQQMSNYEKIIKNLGGIPLGTDKKGYMLMLPNEGFKLEGEYEIKANNFTYSGTNYVEVKFKKPAVHIEV